jgi:hypothetical protein
LSALFELLRQDAGGVRDLADRAQLSFVGDFER